MSGASPREILSAIRDAFNDVEEMPIYELNSLRVHGSKDQLRLAERLADSEDRESLNGVDELSILLLTPTAFRFLLSAYLFNLIKFSSGEELKSSVTETIGMFVRYLSPRPELVDVDWFERLGSFMKLLDIQKRRCLLECLNFVKTSGRFEFPFESQEALDFWTPLPEREQILRQQIKSTFINIPPPPKEEIDWLIASGDEWDNDIGHLLSASVAPELINNVPSSLPCFLTPASFRFLLKAHLFELLNAYSGRNFADMELVWFIEKLSDRGDRLSKMLDFRSALSSAEMRCLFDGLRFGLDSPYCDEQESIMEALEFWTPIEIKVERLMRGIRSVFSSNSAQILLSADDAYGRTQLQMGIDLALELLIKSPLSDDTKQIVSRLNAYIYSASAEFTALTPLQKECVADCLTFYSDYLQVDIWEREQTAL